MNNNTAIGTQVNILANQIFFTSIFILYSQISNPTSPVLELEGVITGGQEYSRYVVQGSQQTLTFPSTMNQTIGLFYHQQLPSDKILDKEYMEKNQQTKILTRANVRLRSLDVVDPVSGKMVGKSYYRLYFQDEHHGRLWEFQIFQLGKSGYAVVTREPRYAGQVALYS